jgi:hypothetical protein
VPAFLFALDDGETGIARNPSARSDEVRVRGSGGATSESSSGRSGGREFPPPQQAKSAFGRFLHCAVAGNVAKEQEMLAKLPIDLPHNYPSWLNTPEKSDELKEVRISVTKGRPFGTMSFTERVVARFGLEMTTKERGRPKKGT